LRPARALRISSAMPSQNQSWSLAALMSVKGRTAIEAVRPEVGLFTADDSEVCLFAAEDPEVAFVAPDGV
jgi:hypothetical protein